MARRIQFTRVGAFLAVGLGLAAAAAAQQVPLPQQTGRLFDRNPQVGGSGVNDMRPFSPFLGGNAFATGNVRGGMSLRSFSPISDPSAFRGTLGSGSLSNFIRDSVSIADAYRPLTAAPVPYFDPATSVQTPGSLRGFSTPGISRAPGDQISPLPGMLNYNVGGIRRLDTRVDASLTPGPLGGTTPIASSIFGATRIPAITSDSPVKPYVPTPLDFRPMPRDLREPAPTDPDTRGLSAPAVGAARIDTRFSPRIETYPLGSPLDSLLGGDTNSLLAQRQAGPTRMTPPRPATPETARPGDATQPPIAERPPALHDLSMLPSYDVFTDIRLAQALRRDPAADWWREMQSQALSMPESAQKLELAQLDTQAFLNKILNAPLKTFVGKGEFPLNDELLRAEGLLQVGQYHDAATRYDRAAMIDPINPLPMIGRGHALLAAGDYLSAAVSLTRGLQNFPDLADFDVDLTSFFSSPEIIDIRRADLMKELERREDPSLRFLLGYLEYYGGERQRGVANLKKAADQADYGTIIKRFPELLRGQSPVVPEQPATDRKDGE